MASVKIVLRKRKNKDGTQPLIIRIIKDRKASIIHLGKHVKSDDWDALQQRVKKSHPNSTRLNNYLISKLAEANDSALTIETAKADVTARAVKLKIKPTTGATFLAQAQDYLDSLKASGKYNQYTADKPRVEHFKQFLKVNDIAFSDVTVGLLEKFVVYLKANYRNKYTEKRLSERSIMNHLVAIRSVFAHGRKNGHVTKEQSPFGESGIKIKFPDTTKVGVSPDDVQKIEDVVLDDPRHHHARNLWLFSFYFAGMRVSDLLRLKWSDFKNYRLHYSMGKNDKGGSLKIPDKAVAILKQYEAMKDESGLIFPELRGVDLSDAFITQRTIAFKTSALDKILRLDVARLADVNAKITMHISRHTFGGMAGDTIPIQMLQKLYRHSHVSTTIGYQGNFIHKDADDALDAVINRKYSSPIETVEKSL